jgi:aryl-alcohol dehydrogenase-like predicted oxidoreductase
MEFRQLGRSGLRVPLVGLGTNNFGMTLDEAGATAVVQAALDDGVTLFDVADHYGEGQAEEFLGRALGARREEAIIATKFGWDMDGVDERAKGSRRYIERALEASLRRLGTDYIDLYQYHRPDGLTPIDETLDALQQLVRRGDVRYIGCSNFSGWQLAEAAETARGAHGVPLISAQNGWSLLNRRVEQELVPAAEHYGVGILPYSPLASGLLTGKYRPDQAHPPGSRLDLWRRSREDASVLMSTDRHWPMPAWQGEQNLTRERNWELVSTLTDYAEERGHALLALAFGWLNASTAVSCVIAGATTPDQIRANVDASAEWQLSADEKAEVDALTADRLSP